MANSIGRKRIDEQKFQRNRMGLSAPIREAIWGIVRIFAAWFDVRKIPMVHATNQGRLRRLVRSSLKFVGRRKFQPAQRSMS